MEKRPNEDTYKLSLKGSGVTIERAVPEATARQIIALVMGGTGGAEQLTPMQGTSPGVGGPIDASTPKAFMTSKRPKSDMERVTCLGYFLTNYRNTPAFKTKDLIELNTEAAQQKLSNPSSTARNAVGHGYLSLAGGGQKQITARGEALVEALPDREKVQAAIEEHPIKKPRKKRKPRKAK